MDFMARFIFLYAAMYAAFGVASPFLPAFVTAGGLPPEQLGLVLAAGTAVRLLSAPLAGRIADLIGRLRIVLAVCAAMPCTAVNTRQPRKAENFVMGSKLASVLRRRKGPDKSSGSAPARRSDRVRH